MGCRIAILAVALYASSARAICGVPGGQLLIRGYPQNTYKWRVCTPQLVGSETEEDKPDLASLFASEASRRKAANERSTAPGPVLGDSSTIREIVLDDMGRPVSIPRRPAPPPGITASGELGQLLRSPSFAFGCILAVGSTVLLVAIAAADSAASY
jgi:hypothetical protein